MITGYLLELGGYGSATVCIAMHGEMGSSGHGSGLRAKQRYHLMYNNINS